MKDSKNKNIHATAIVHPNAKIHESVEIGAYSIIGPDVEIGEGTWIGNHVNLSGLSSFGKNNKIWHFCSLGEPPQDKKYNNEETKLVVGDGNVIREFCTFNTGTEQGGGVTYVGNDNWIMAYCHIAHDCRVGNNTIFANNSCLAGYVVIKDWVILGGYTAIHQFCLVGDHAMSAAATVITQDVPPYVLACGFRAEPKGINIEGLRRRGFSPTEIESIKWAYKTLYRNGFSYEEAKGLIIAESKKNSKLEVFLSFFEESQRGMIR